MKVISLNTWGGRGGLDGLLDFFTRHRDVDVFCLQEVWDGNEDMVGVVTGVTGVLTGNNVSHAMNKTRRRWLPNLQSVRIDDRGTHRTVNGSGPIRSPSAYAMISGVWILISRAR